MNSFFISSHPDVSHDGESQVRNSYISNIDPLLSFSKDMLNVISYVCEKKVGIINGQKYSLSSCEFLNVH